MINFLPSACLIDGNKSQFQQIHHKSLILYIQNENSYTIKLIYTNSYIKRASKFAKRHPELLSQYEKTLKILECDPSHKSLRLHPLKGKLKNLYSVSINISYRITLEFIVTEKEIILVNVGHHDEVY